MNGIRRIDTCFAELKKKNRAAFIPFVMGGDPDFESSLELLQKLPDAGADLIEIGLPFSDPMADGPAVQASAIRALENGQNLHKALELVCKFRETNQATPLIGMGYFNPIYRYGAEKFIADALKAGLDGLIVVDCPPEVDEELCIPATKAGLAFIRLIAPTTNDERLPLLLKNASGFLYLVSIAGVTGTTAADPAAVSALLERVRKQTDLPVAVGFGVKTGPQAATLAKSADAIVIASVLLDIFSKKSADAGVLKQIVADYLKLSRDLSASIHQARDSKEERPAKLA
ncbi:MAG: tryptophan synthase subunit alpha [Pseudomonadota bacterium]